VSLAIFRRLMPRISDILKVRVYLPHIFDDISESLQHSNGKCVLQVEFPSYNSFRYFAFCIRDGVGECGGKLSEPVALDKQVEILIPWRPSECLEEGWSDRVLVAIEIRRK
jgi:hypothetical protein